MFFYICHCESLNLVKYSTPPHFIFLSLALLSFLFLLSTRRDSFSNLVDIGLKRLVVDVSVDDPMCLFREWVNSLNSRRKTKVLGHFREWFATLVPMNRHEVSDRREPQSKPPAIKSFPLKVKEPRIFETESLVFPSMLQKTGALESTVTALVSFKGELSGHVGGALDPNAVEGCYRGFKQWRCTRNKIFGLSGWLLGGMKNKKIENNNKHV